MPDKDGRIKGTTTIGLKNAWLDAVQAEKDRDRELERESEGFDELFDPLEQLHRPHHHP